MAAALSSLNATSAPSTQHTHATNPYAVYASSQPSLHASYPAHVRPQAPLGGPPRYTPQLATPYASRYATATPHTTGVYNTGRAEYSHAQQLSLPYTPSPVGQAYGGAGRAPALRPSLQPARVHTPQAAVSAAPAQPRKAVPTYKFNVGSSDRAAQDAKLHPHKPAGGDLARLDPGHIAAGGTPRRDPATGKVLPYRDSFNRDIKIKGGNPNMFKVEWKCIAAGTQSGSKGMYMAQVLNTTKNNIVVGRTEEPVRGRSNAVNVAFFNALRNPDATRGMFWQEKEQRKVQSMAGQHVLRYLGVCHIMENHSQLAPADVQELLQGLLDERMVSALHGRMLETEPDNPYCRCDVANGGIKRHATCVYSWVWRKHAELQCDAKATWDATALIWNRMPVLLRPIYERHNAAKLRREEEAARAALGGHSEKADLSGDGYEQPQNGSAAAAAAARTEESEAEAGWTVAEDDLGEDTDIEDAAVVEG